MINAFLALDNRFKNLRQTMQCLEHINVQTTIVSAEKINDFDCINGDIFAIIKNSRTDFSMFICNPVNFHIKLNEKFEVQCLSLSKKKSSDLILSFENLKQRAKIAKFLDTKAIYDCSIVCANKNFWEKVFKIHSRLMKYRHISIKENYFDLIINFCISLYDYKVSLIQGV